MHCIRNGSFITALLVLSAATAWSAEVSFRETPVRVEITIDGRPFSNFYYGGEWAQPFLHPLRMVSGVSVTRGYPVEVVEGESEDHIWHHGLWFSHGDINGVDFWRDLGPEATGRMVLREPAQAEGDRLTAELDLITPDKTRVGRVTEEFRFDRQGDIHLVDGTFTIHADAGSAIKLGDTEEGTLGIRFADEFREDRGAILTNSDHLVGTDNIWGKRAEWVDYSTELKGETAGVLILDHPSNPKHPTYWHARGYGLNAANPFGEHDFTGDDARDGSMTIPEGESVTFRYRVVIHPGLLDAVDPEKLAADFEQEQVR